MKWKHFSTTGWPNQPSSCLVTVQEPRNCEAVSSIQTQSVQTKIQIQSCHMCQKQIWSKDEFVASKNRKLRRQRVAQKRAKSRPKTSEKSPKTGSKPPKNGNESRTQVKLRPEQDRTQISGATKFQLQLKSRIKSRSRSRPIQDLKTVCSIQGRIQYSDPVCIQSQDRTQIFIAK